MPKKLKDLQSNQRKKFNFSLNAKQNLKNKNPILTQFQDGTSKCQDWILQDIGTISGFSCSVGKYVMTLPAARPDKPTDSPAPRCTNPAK